MEVAAAAALVVVVVDINQHQRDIIVIHRTIALTDTTQAVVTPADDIRLKIATAAPLEAEQGREAEASHLIGAEKETDVINMIVAAEIPIE